MAIWDTLFNRRMASQPPASIQRGFGPQIGMSSGSYNPAQPATQNMSFADRIFGPHMLPIAGALMSGRPEALGRGFTAAGLIQQDEADRRRDAQQRQAAINATAQYLEKDNPEAAEAIRAGAPVGPIMAEMARGRTKPSAYQEQLTHFRQNPEEWEQMQRAKKGYMGQIPPGHRLTYSEAGEPQIVPIQGGPKERERIEGIEQSAVNTKDMLDKIDQALVHPGRMGATGLSGILASRPGSEGRAYLALHNQLTGKTFLQAYETLKGGGQITEVEGRKAEQAIARLDRWQSDEDYEAALKDLRDVVQSAYNRQQQKLGAPVRESDQVIDYTEYR